MIFCEEDTSVHPKLVVVVNVTGISVPVFLNLIVVSELEEEDGFNETKFHE